MPNKYGNGRLAVMIRRSLTVYTVMGDPEMGVWCDGCMLPAKIVWPVHLLTSRGVANAQAERCLNCDPREGDGG